MLGTGETSLLLAEKKVRRQGTMITLSKQDSPESEESYNGKKKGRKTGNPFFLPMYRDEISHDVSDEFRIESKKKSKSKSSHSKSSKSTTRRGKTGISFFIPSDEFCSGDDDDDESFLSRNVSDKSLF